MAYNTQPGYATVGEAGEPWYKTYKWYLVAALVAGGLGTGYWYKRRQKRALYGCGCE